MCVECVTQCNVLKSVVQDNAWSDDRDVTHVAVHVIFLHDNILAENIAADET